MRVSVEEGRFISLPCDPIERIVFDRQAGTFHLLRSSAARLWEEIEAGGLFDLEDAAGPDDETPPLSILAEAGLVQLFE